MKIYTNGSDAISDLHRDGFVNDFQVSGNDLLCVQEGFFIRPGEFFVAEFHPVLTGHHDEGGRLIVFGIDAPYYNMKGILISHCR